MSRVTILTILVLLLIAVNGVTLFFLLRKKDNRGGRPSPALFFKKLNLDPQQEQQFETLRKNHFQIRDSLRNEEQRLRKSMTDMITSGTKNSARIDSITGSIAVIRKQFELNFYNHFQQLHSLLRPDQQQKFGEVVEMIMKRQGPPAGNRPEPPPNH